MCELKATRADPLDGAADTFDPDELACNATSQIRSGCIGKATRSASLNVEAKADGAVPNQNFLAGVHHTYAHIHHCIHQINITNRAVFNWQCSIR